MAIRYLWITIRAMQYTDRAFKAVQQNIGNLVKAEGQLKSSGDMLKLSAGLMWMALGTMAIGAMSNLMRVSKEGRQVMNSLDRSIRDLSKSFGEAFTKTLGPAIRVLTMFLNALAKAPPWLLTMLSAGALVLIGLGMMKASFWVLSSVLKMVGFDFQRASMSLIQYNEVGQIVGVANNSLKGSFLALGFHIKNAFIYFSIFLSIGLMFGKQGSIIVAVIGSITVAIIALGWAMKHTAMWQSALTFGLSAIAGLAGAAMLSQQMPSFQVGTRRAQFTGPALVHAGERIGKEDALKRELGGNAPQKSQTNVAITFSGNIQTKADKEQLKPLILKSIKEALDNKV